MMSSDLHPEGQDERAAMEAAWFGSPLSRVTERTVQRREGFEHGWRAAKALQAELRAGLDQAVTMANDHAAEIVALGEGGEEWRCPDCGSGVTKVHASVQGLIPCGKPRGYWTVESEARQAELEATLTEAQSVLSGALLAAQKGVPWADRRVGIVMHRIEAALAGVVEAEPDGSER